ncbi:MAG TPA: DNA-directed RNA polymerase subunit beta' [Ignavibacteriales bacterium]|nr:DNA-directed RNA polymerase subunit beta' [Ignavibacteriales bacterium]
MPNILEEPIKSINNIAINLASPDDILSWSHGEVTKPETINYRTFKPERDGLFCEKIFGPVKDWECSCGKYRRIKYKGIVCDKCGVEVTQKAVRRERMGHISLAVPVVHIWYFKSSPSKIAAILGMTNKELEKIIYYETYVVINPGKTGLERLDLLTDEQYQNIIITHPGNDALPNDHPDKFVVKIGGDAIRELLRQTDINKLIETLKEKVDNETSSLKKSEILKRLRIIESFRADYNKIFNKPEWMVLSVIPVIPPELRPLVPLDGGRFASSDLNDLYRRVIIRNNRLKKLMEMKAPEVILKNEKRMLQEAVDALLDNSRRANAVTTENSRPLKSLSDMLKGKQGRFRQNLLGKRVDYSGRSVIVVGPELKLHQCGLPKDMAIELFAPFVIRRLIERGVCKTVKSAKKLLKRKDPVVWEVLENVVQGHPVLLNRAPTLHRLGIQAFQPVLIDEKAIRLHPMVCTAFNADFDGDQMAVHVPLSYDAQLEAMVLMLSSHNILSPQNGNPIVVPTQDIILGIYYLTKIRPGAKGEGMVFANFDEVIIAYNHNVVDLHAKIKVRYNNSTLETNVGRVIFNQIVPEEFGYINKVLVKKEFSGIIYQMFIKLGHVATAKFLDDMKELGYFYSTKAGISISYGDVIIPKEKDQIIKEAFKEIKIIQEEYEQGLITEGERYNKVVDVWTHTTNNLAEVLNEQLQKVEDGFNPLFMMVDSGARGSKDQVKQLGAMRGLMQKPQKSLTGQTGEIIENPIISNFKEGLSVLEYFISTHGARKGLADTALKTADAGYLTRRLVDVAQDVIVTEEDCGTVRGLDVYAVRDGSLERQNLADRITGRVAQEDIYNPLNDELIVPMGEVITEEAAELIDNAGIDRVHIRTVLTCEAQHGVCSKCYGINLTTGQLANVGEAVGIVAAQSIGEPGTQLTLRTFHMGGTSQRIAEQSEVKSPVAGIVEFDRINYVERTNYFGNKIKVVVGRRGNIILLNDDGTQIKRIAVPYGAELFVDDGDKVIKDQKLFSQDPYNSLIISEFSGKVQYEDMIPGVTVQNQTDDQTGHVQKIVIDVKDKNYTPSIAVIDKDGNKKVYNIPFRAILTVEDGEEIEAGTTLAKISKSTAKTRDITGGLPRVTELFEARAPHDAAIISEIDGVVKFGARKKGTREVIVVAVDGKDIRTYNIPYGKHILVQDGDEIQAGEKITDGPINPHDILRIKGINEVQNNLVNEIQDVYRLQGVKINDKHIEVIVKQMLRKVKIKNPGDTKFIEEDLVDASLVQAENQKMLRLYYVEDPSASKLKKGYIITALKVKETNAELRAKGLPELVVRETRGAEFENVLLGITNAALTTESFLSAASFQETTKVLTNAAVKGKIDHMVGLKENVQMGNLIPAGTGLKKYKNIILETRKASTEELNRANRNLNVEDLEDEMKAEMQYVQDSSMVDSPESEASFDSDNE